MPAVKSSKLRQIEFYVRETTLSRRELELQWKKNSNEDYFRTMNFAYDDNVSGETAMRAKARITNIVRWLDSNVELVLEVASVMSTYASRCHRRRRHVYDISSCADIPRGSHYVVRWRPKGEAFPRTAVSMSEDFLREFKDRGRERRGTVSQDVRADNFPLNTVSKNSGPSSNDHNLFSFPAGFILKDFSQKLRHPTLKRKSGRVVSYLSGGLPRCYRPPKERMPLFLSSPCATLSFCTLVSRTRLSNLVAAEESPRVRHPGRTFVLNDKLYPQDSTAEKFPCPPIGKAFRNFGTCFTLAFIVRYLTFLKCAWSITFAMSMICECVFFLFNE